MRYEQFKRRIEGIFSVGGFEPGPQVQKAHDLLSRAIEALERKVRPRAPSLWIDPHRPLLPVLPSAKDLLSVHKDRLEEEKIWAEHLAMLGDSSQSKLLSALSQGEKSEYLTADNFPLPATGDREGYWGD